ncbi:MAG TPA: bifunctional precorrin-2 dehydrogenase/sirohydrochlorin ferrochelatase [Polyangiaceae bacterium]|nr:bifunctional precorrin-2 dehydrogenase/sirohydrochlorin ferrochelatase [Polyangiaceae bacterium]
MTVFPIALKLARTPCLVVGGGDEAELRAQNLLRAGALVTVVTPSPSAALLALEGEGRITLKRRPFEAGDLDEPLLIVLADLDAELAAQIGALARARRRLFCAVDQPADNTYLHMSTTWAGSLGVAITTGGAAPGLARKLREEVERVFAAAGLGRFVERLAERRRRTPPERRRAEMSRLVAGVRLTGALELPGVEDDQD